MHGHADEKLDSPRSQRRNYSVRTTEVYERRDHLGRAGVVFDEDTLQYNDKGEPKFVYIKGDFGGFAIHLLNR